MLVQVDNPLIEVHDLTVSYDKKPVLWNIDFSLAAGQIIGIIGPNGAGKSTLLKSIMSLIEPQSGYVKIYGKSIDDVRGKISYVPQRESVDWDFPASVLDVVLMGRYQKRGLFGRYNKEDKRIAQESLEKVGMQGFVKRQISQLSGGQQQRVFLARALAQQTELYLMDEPFAGVDASTEESILNLMKEMTQAGKTILVVHHDLQTAFKYFDWMVLLNTRLIASCPAQDALNESLIQETYGGKLPLLSALGNLIKNKDMPIREKK